MEEYFLLILSNIEGTPVAAFSAATAVIFAKMLMLLVIA